jgi:mono/diheme cytochrome c family protein
MMSWMSRMRAGLFFFLLSLFLVSGPVGDAAAKDKNDTNPFAGDAAAIEEGEALFQAVCTGYCHVTSGAQREAKCPDLFDCEWKNGKSDKEMMEVVLNGVPNTEMAPFKGQLPDEMLWQILAYVKSASTCGDGKQDGEAAEATEAVEDGKAAAASAHE